MSLFFDVWTKNGFVLASDVRLIRDDHAQYMHKLACSPRSSAIPCAIAVCGEYPEVPLGAFAEAAAVGKNLREVAYRLADRWVERFAGTEEYSAVHLVGFEKLDDTDWAVPQVWFWCNWVLPGRYLPQENLRRQLETFADPIPHNNHLHTKISELHKHCSLAEERYHVLRYLSRGPWFTWNGDTDFWRSAGSTVQAVAALFGGRLRKWKLEQIADLTELCLRFLVELGGLAPDPTVGLSPEEQCDVVIVTPASAVWRSRSKLPSASGF